MQHPRQWELDVQSHIRNLRVQPIPSSEAVLVGVADSQVVAVSHFGAMASRTQLAIFAIGTSIGNRRQGLASTCLGITIRVLKERAKANFITEPLLARVDEHNLPSQALFGEHGFEKAGVDGRLGLWLRPVV